MHLISKGGICMKNRESDKGGKTFKSDQSDKGGT